MRRPAARLPEMSRLPSNAFLVAQPRVQDAPALYPLKAHACQGTKVSTCSGTTEAWSCKAASLCWGLCCQPCDTKSAAGFYAWLHACGM